MHGGEHSLSHSSTETSTPCMLPISDLLEISKLISRVEPIELLLEKTSSTISSTFKVRSLVICLLDDQSGMFVPRHVRGFPEDNATAIRKHTYSMDRKKRDLLRGHRIEHRTYYVRAEDEEVMTNEDLDYVIDQPKVRVSRESPEHWHPLDYMLFLMVDRLGNWIGWIEIDYMADGRIPPKDAVHRIQLLADLIGIATENSKIYEEAISAMMESREYLDLIVHDLGNMVNPLIHYLDKMGSSGTLDSENSDSLAKALTMSKAAKSLVDDVRRLSEARSVEVSGLGRYDLRDVLVRCISTLKTEFPARDIVVSLDCPDGECVIAADNLVHDLFLNVLGNAVRHDPSTTAEIDISIQNGAGVWTVTIEDHGTGAIAEEHRSWLFTGNGRRGNDRMNGNGMGMSIVNLLVERYSGVISVRDRVDGAPSEGACFEIAFPKADGHEPVRHQVGERAGGSGPLSYGS